jgi:hypothetical protein
MPFRQRGVGLVLCGPRHVDVEGGSSDDEKGDSWSTIG